MIRLINVLKKYFQPKVENTDTDNCIKPGSIYGVGSGRYTGKFFVFVEQTNHDKRFLTLPDMQIQIIPNKKFEIGIQNNIIEFQEVLPKKVYKVCKQQYEQSKSKSNN